METDGDQEAHVLGHSALNRSFLELHALPTTQKLPSIENLEERLGMSCERFLHNLLLQREYGYVCFAPDSGRSTEVPYNYTVKDRVNFHTQLYKYLINRLVAISKLQTAGYDFATKESSFWSDAAFVALARAFVVVFEQMAFEQSDSGGVRTIIVKDVRLKHAWEIIKRPSFWVEFPHGRNLRESRPTIVEVSHGDDSEKVAVPSLWATKDPDNIERLRTVFRESCNNVGVVRALS